MTIVIRPAPQAKRKRLESPHCGLASGDAIAICADERSPELGDRSKLPAPIGIRAPPSLRNYLGGYEQLSKAGVAFYPIRPDKSPAVKGKLNRAVTTDPLKIRFWVEHGHHWGLAARILRRSRLMVIDTESPFKHTGKLGPDGELVFCELLMQHDIHLPPCPMTQTPSMGFHRYLLVPKGFRIRPAVGLWPGVDILAVGSNAILPGSRTESGEYKPVRSHDECPVPEAPIALIKLIQSAQKKPQINDRSVPMEAIPVGDRSSVSRRQWFLLFRNRVFRSFWNRTAKQRDSTDSAYEYHLAKACFCCGLNESQVVSVILAGWEKFGLRRSVSKLRAAIIPAAWREVSPWVGRWKAAQGAAESAPDATKTSRMILAYVAESRSQQTPASIAAALPIPRERAKKAMQRMAADGGLQRTSGGYIVAAVRTF